MTTSTLLRLTSQMPDIVYPRPRPQLCFDLYEAMQQRPQVLDELPYPLDVSDKVDAFRVMASHHWVTVGREGKDLKNRFAHEGLNQLMHYLPNGTVLDGELTCRRDCAVGNPIHALLDDYHKYFYDFNDVSSALRSHEGQPAWSFLVFDCLDLTQKVQLPREARNQKVREFIANIHLCEPQTRSRLHALAQTRVTNRDELVGRLGIALNRGYEGIVASSPLSVYKHGRGTLSAGQAYKLKPFVDAEAQAKGFVELELNQNDPEFNTFGLQVRGHSKEGKVKAGRLGAIIAWSPRFGEFRVGGFTDAQSVDIWANQRFYLDKWFKYKYQDYGIVDKPRSPVFLGFIDMDMH